MFKLYFLLTLCLSLLTLSQLRIQPKLNARQTVSHVDPAILYRGHPRFVPTRFIPRASASTSDSAALERPLAQIEEAVIVTPNRVRPKGSAFGASLEKSKVGPRTRPNDIVLPHNTKSQTQGQVGSCHIFTMTQVLAAMIFRETGKYLDPASYFSDHIARESMTNKKNPLQSFVNTHLKEIKSIRAGTGCEIFEEGGFFDQDLKLIQMVGSELISLSSKEYSSVVRSVGALRSARTSLINSKLDLDLATQQARLEKPAMEILSRTAFGVSEKDDRALVKDIVKNVKFLSLRFNDRYGRLPVDKAYKSAKMDLIDLLHKNGVLWLGVEADLYYGRAKPKIQTDSLFSTSGDHAIALVGYQSEGDLFLIKDSNKQGLLKISASKLLPSLEEAYALKK